MDKTLLLTGLMASPNLSLGIALETIASLDQNHAGEYASNLTVLGNRVPEFKNLFWLALVFKCRHRLLDLSLMNCLENQRTVLELGHVLN